MKCFQCNIITDSANRVYQNQFLEPILKRYAVTIKEVQIEIVSVTKDLSDEIHYHKEAFASVVIMGKDDHVRDPIDAAAYYNDFWFPIRAGDCIYIPARVPHGFTIQENGILYFLSVQAPPIVDEQGRDDYFSIA